ncbi:acetate kinase [Aliiroseovarius sp. S1339]|uniref:acetate/propionate family kinase n=1 Tax=Aliiroseovarius sp. S1339 TaxID=2936990 RepID=UPI0020BEA438|nr:acetate kinase [Aliiroseovarius sp. S1339]MCK8465535.1 acetate kinase [Aliiroseovarius sp. S1339]
MSDQLVVTFNAGSSSLRCGVFKLAADGPLQVRNFHIRGLPGQMLLTEKDLKTGRLQEFDLGAPSSADRAHPEALTHMLARLDALSDLGNIAAFSHRIVHGGTDHATPVKVTDDVLERLKKLEPLAPSHQPHNLRPIRQLRAHYPGIPQIACFDTAFHRTQPRVAQIFGLPRDLTDDGVLRYGFHGLSYDYIAHTLARSYPDLAAKRIIVAQLGRGVSVCAMKDGRSVATTMGLTALDGLPMGRRCGALDPGVVLHLIMDRGHSPEEVRAMLYEQSGLLGVSGITGEMNDLLTSDRAEAAEAVDFFTYQCGRSFGSLAAAMGGVDGVVLTGGMGEHIPTLRARLVRELAWLGAELDEVANGLGGPVLTTDQSRLPVLMLPTDEERVLARRAYEVLEGHPTA